MFYYTDEFLPTAHRKINETGGKYIIPKDGHIYECCSSDILQTHDDCLLCNINIEERLIICYVKFSIPIPKSYNVYMYGIPRQYKMEYLEAIKKMMKRKTPGDEPLRFGSVKCPFHEDKHNSAIHNKNGSIYCFACCKLFKK